MNEPTFKLFAICSVLCVSVHGFNCTPNKIPEYDEIQQCCDSPTITQTDIINECQNEGPSVLGWAECYFQKINAIADGKPNIKALKLLSKIVLAEYPAWSDKFDSVIDLCSVEVAEKDDETQKRLSRAPYNMKNVNSIYAHLIVCIDAGLWLGCPDAKRDKNVICTEIQDFMAECLTDFPPPYFTFDI